MESFQKKKQYNLIIYDQYLVSYLNTVLLSKQDDTTDLSPNPDQASKPAASGLLSKAAGIQSAPHRPLLCPQLSIGIDIG